ncbi:MAG: M48 family metallopeptidase [Rickettsiales bacterium]|jgi:predicted metal-dependent hydrolase|nr:M48 family metallopeptidase [Rickettsiales bacterium]
MTYEYSLALDRTDGTTKVMPVEFRRVISSKSIRITPDLARQSVKVTYPFYVPRARAIDFLESKKEWVAAKLLKAPERRRIADGTAIDLFGRRLRIAHIPGARRGVWSEGEHLFVSGGAEFLHRRVMDHVKSEALKYFGAATRAYGAKLGVKVGRIRVKDTVSRWGSCSANGDMSFSWRLAFAPLYVAEYIAAHEVAHRIEMNHGIKFWRLLRRAYDGNIDAAAKWLARNGAKLWGWE